MVISERFYIEDNVPTLIRGTRKVEFIDLGEGMEGEYLETDDKDVPLLRFVLHRWDGEDWTELCSQLTLLPVDFEEGKAEKALGIILDVLERNEDLEWLDRAAYRLSWLSVHHVEAGRLASWLQDDI